MNLGNVVAQRDGEKILTNLNRTKCITIRRSKGMYLSFIAYYSPQPRTLELMTKNFMTAIYEIIKHFRYSSKDRNFIIFIDHKPLTFAFQ